MQDSLEQRVKNALVSFMRSKRYSEQRAEMRTAVFVDEYEPKLARLFLLDKIEGFIRQIERADVRAAEAAGRAESPQLRFAAPGFAELFSSLHQRMPLKRGTVRLDRMTVGQLRESAAVLRAKARKRAEKTAHADERRAQWLEEMADAISPHAREHRKLEVGDYLDLCAEGIIRAKVPAAAGASAGAGRRDDA
jgi:malonyl CoA-acyl carrier protein transacylase